MKYASPKMLLSILTLLLLSMSSYADKYEEAMTQLVQQMDTSQNSEAIPALINSFERIARKEKTQWLPYYYAAYLEVISIYTNKPEDIAARMDRADELSKSAWNAESPDSSELYALESMIATARIMENPMKMGRKYGPMAAELLEKAKSANPNNPRVYLLQGESKYYTPKMWGGSKEKAKKLFQLAKEKYASSTPPSEIHPHWGADRVDEYLENME